MRYTLQRSVSDCGPVAVLNALRWAGRPAPYSQVKDLRRKLKLGTKQEGVDLGRMNQFLTRECRYLKGKKVKTFREMERHLEKSGIVLLRFCWSKTNGHYCLITRRLKEGKIFETVNMYEVINGSNVPAKVGISRSDLKRSMRDYKSKSTKCLIWLLDKR